jgi:hypothetical protein
MLQIRIYDNIKNNKYEEFLDYNYNNCLFIININDYYFYERNYDLYLLAILFKLNKEIYSNLRRLKILSNEFNMKYYLI